jgi:type IV pilus assembly protein PilQ
LGLTLAGLSRAGEIASLAWEGGDEPVLRIGVAGGNEVPYQAQALEDGRRLRLIFPGSRMGAGLAELSGKGFVKGVYPYLAENGANVNIDLLLSQPGGVKVEPVAGGLRVIALANQPATATVAPSEGGAAAASVPPAAAAAEAASNAIEDILYAKLPGDRVQITLKMSRPPQEPNAFTITNPARISLDFPDTRVKLARPSVNVGVGAVTKVTVVEGERRARVVLNLIKPVSYRSEVQGNNYVLVLDAPTSAIAAATEPKVTHFAGTRKLGKYSLTNVDFRRGSQGEGKIIVTLSDPAIGVDIREQAGEIILEFLNTSVPESLQRRLDVVDFATPVQTIDVFQRNANTRMVITPKGKYEHVAYQAGNVFTVSVKPIVEKEGEKKPDEFGYTGERLSLNFQNIDVRAALQVLADFTGLNFVVSDTVKGSLTLRLKDVPWDQALDIIVDAKNLAVRRKGNVITVAPAAEVAAKEKAAFEAAKAALELEPLVSELIQINYAKAADIANLLKSIKPVTAVGAAVHPVFGPQATGSAVQAATESNTLLSPRGQVTVDERTNSILVQDTPAKIREIRKLIAQLDQPVRQVMVETRLVEATDTFAKTLGVRLGGISDKTRGGTRRLVSGKLEYLDKYTDPDNPQFEYIPSGLAVNLPASNLGNFVSSAISLTIFKNYGLLDLELSALEQEGKGKIISSPRVITANQKKAVIEQGQERVFTTNVLGVGSVVTKKATLKLEVTPQITPDERVNLDVVITKDNFADAVTGLLNVKQIQTNVLLDNGETVAIGGIFEQDANDTKTQVPYFGDLPLLGWLFKNKQNRDNKTELLIFLTPRILSEQLSSVR